MRHLKAEQMLDKVCRQAMAFVYPDDHVTGEHQEHSCPGKGPLLSTKDSLSVMRSSILSWIENLSVSGDRQE